MVRLLLFFSTIAAFTFVSCTSTMELHTEVTVLDHSSCDSNDGALIKLEATGGTAPYVFTIWDQSDNSQIHSYKTDESVVMVGKKDLFSIDYSFVLTDSDGVKQEKDFQVIPEGKSVIASQLIMQNEEFTLLPENIEIQLMKLGSKDGGLETTYTDHEGKYIFENLPAGIYTIEVILHEKYDDYVLLPKNSNTRIRIETGTHTTTPFSLACSENFAADLVITN